MQDMEKLRAMHTDAQLQALVMGSTVVQLREKRKLRQAQLADASGIPTSTLCYIERGRGVVDLPTLGKLAQALGVKQTQIVDLVNDGLQRAEKAARQTLQVPARGWWQAVQERIGPRGAEGLVTFVVASVMADQRKRVT